jgi:hypothetical protein
MTYAAIGRELGISRERVKQVLDRIRRAERRRGELVEKYAPCPDIAALPDDTPIDVLELCDGGMHGWAARISHLKHSHENPIRTLGDLRRTTDAQLRKEPNVGKKMVAELRRFCPREETRELVDSASVRTTMERAIGHLRRAFGAIEELQGVDLGVARTASWLQDARAEMERAIALLEGMRR